jgi:hypothetical protein
MKKLLLGAVASAALFAGAANAVITPALPTVGVYTITQSGASASQPYFERYLTGAGVPLPSRLCAGAITKHIDSTVPNQFAYSCVANKVGNPTLAAAMGVNTVLLVKKRTAGGSGWGVGPVAIDATIPFLGGSAKPDFGLSDLAPSFFTAANPYNVDATILGLPTTSAIIASNLTVLPVARQMFGVVLSTAFRDALQNAQFAAAVCKLAGSGVNGRESLACMPNLTVAQITQLIKRGGTTLAGGTIANGTVHTCGRTDGSGTKAVTAQKICEAAGNTPVLSACQGIAAPYLAANTPVSPSTITRAGGRYHEMASASGVAECLSELNQGVNIGTSTAFTMSGLPAWAIGYQSTDNNAFVVAPGAGTTGQYRFIKVGGVAPTLVNAAAATYTDVGLSSCQYNKTAAAAVHLPASKKALITQICAGMKNVLVINAVNALVAKHTWGQAGFLP